MIVSKSRNDALFDRKPFDPRRPAGAADFHKSVERLRVFRTLGYVVPKVQSGIKSVLEWSNCCIRGRSISVGFEVLRHFAKNDPSIVVASIVINSASRTRY